LNSPLYLGGFRGESTSVLYPGTAEPLRISPAKPVAYIMELSRKRAEAVKQWFVDHKVDRSDAIRTIPRGEKEAIAPNRNPDGSDNPEGRRMNRRVVIRADWNF